MATAPIAGERFDIGRVAALTFGVIGRHPVLFIGVALIFSGLPALAVSVLNLTAAIDAIAGIGLGTMVVSLLTFFLLGGLMQTSLVVATLQDLSGQRVDLAACLRRALVMLLPVIGVSILVGLGVAFGTVLLVVPGVMLYIMWFVAVPALVEERRGIFAALGRSRELTRGSRWPIFGLVVAFVVFTLVAGLGTALLTGLSVAAGADQLAENEFGVAVVINAFVSMLTSLVSSTGVAATYVELRTVKEGANVDALAAVFA